MFFVSTISTYTLYRRIIKQCFFKSEYTAFCIMNICCMNVNRKNIPHNICYYVSLSPFRFFLHHSLFYHLLRLSLQIVNQSGHMLNFLFFHLLFSSWKPTFLISCPRLLFSMYDSKTIVKHWYCFPVRKIFRQISPLASGLYQIQYCIHHLPFFIFTFIACRKVVLYDFPLYIC